MNSAELETKLKGGAIRDELICGAMQVDLANGQEIFIDPTYHFGIRLGGAEQRAIWLENQSAPPTESVVKLTNR